MSGKGGTYLESEGGGGYCMARRFGARDRGRAEVRPGYAVHVVECVKINH